MARPSFNAHASPAHVNHALRWLVVVWAALIVLNGTGIHHRQAALSWADAPIAPVHHIHHADQRIVAPLTAEAEVGVTDQQAPATGPAALDLFSPAPLPLALVEWDANPRLRDLGNKELPSRAPPSFLSA